MEWGAVAFPGLVMELQPRPRARLLAGFHLQRPHVVERAAPFLAQRARARVAARENDGVEDRLGGARLARFRDAARLIRIERLDVAPHRHAPGHVGQQRRLAGRRRGLAERLTQRWPREARTGARCDTTRRRCRDRAARSARWSTRSSADRDTRPLPCGSSSPTGRLRPGDGSPKSDATRKRPPAAKMMVFFIRGHSKLIAMKRLCLIEGRHMGRPLHFEARPGRWSARAAPRRRQLSWIRAACDPPAACDRRDVCARPSGAPREQAGRAAPVRARARTAAPRGGVRADEAPRIAGRPCRDART